jgi:hypothetical protein
MAAFGLWPGCFRSVLLRLVIPTGATAEVGGFCGLYRRLPRSRLVLFSFTKRAHHIFPVRHPYDSAHLQRFGLPGHD